MTFGIQHRTTGAYLTEHGIPTPALRGAVQFGTRAEAVTAHAAIEDFAGAWDVVPIVGADWPEEFPGAWQHWPDDLKKVAGRLLLEDYLEQFGAGDLVKSLTMRLGRVSPSTGRELTYTTRPEHCWLPFLVHARRRAARALFPSSPPSP